MCVCVLRNLESPCDRSEFGALRHYQQDHHDTLCVLNVLSLCVRVFKRKEERKKMPRTRTHKLKKDTHNNGTRDSPKQINEQIRNGQVRYTIFDGISQSLEMEKCNMCTE